MVLTTHDTDAGILQAVEAGGETVLAPAVAATRLGKMRVPVEEKLSARALEVFGLVAGGASNAGIAMSLRIREATIKSRLLHIFGKLG